MTRAPEATRAAEQFLQSVVIFDDEAYTPSGGAYTATSGAAVFDDSYGGMAEEHPPSRGAEDAGELDTEKVVRAFAQLGMNCAVLAPSGDGRERDLALLGSLARRADVVILDWLIGSAPAVTTGDVAIGEDPTSFSFIETVLAQDSKVGSRLRLICIYSGERDLERVKASVLERLRKKFDQVFDGGEEALSVTVGDARIVFFSKVHAEGPAEPDEVSVDDVAARVIREFTGFAANGILPSIALTSLAVLRDQAHRLLQRFHGGLDAPMIAHRAMTTPAATEEFLVSLFADEVEALISNGAVRQHLSDERVAAAIRGGSADDSHRFVWKNAKTPAVSVSTADAVATLMKSHEGDLVRVQKGADLHKLEKTSSVTSLALDGIESAVREVAHDADMNFSILSSLARDGYLEGEDGLPPTLRLGSIVARRSRRRVPGTEAGGRYTYSVLTEYLLCLQPLCDSTRLDKETRFPFLPLTPGDAGRFAIVVREEGGPRTLTHKLSLADLRSIAFEPSSPKRAVVGTWNDGHWGFGERGQRFQWLGDLRLDKAQSVIAALSAQASRVGTNDYEYLRRRSQA
ncbi:hypothetical protein CLV46_2532 [Diaminobutyricimonas aerilata]|uniref:Response receiver domain-containing protein n=1 Tax=Diaminobutyricimonas aerilata TaxID=1162967 RepID=A0A2M9CM51_9MICO|nr:response regulator receiver domain [Diaminobutyricimonas aerilata]PJJ72953.1 hypothetical protein CLV46_2532 [Diaminobutyricimonas aerilata]